VTVTGTITGTTDDGGGLDTYWIALWDDLEVKDSLQLTVPVGTTQPFTATLGFLGLYGTGYPGIGVHINETVGGSSIFYEDPFYPLDVPGSCGVVPTTTPIPVPTLSAWSLALLGAGVAGAAWVATRRRKKNHC
jgi:hypothetical protein